MPNLVSTNSRSAEINRIKRIEKIKGTKMQTRIRLPDMRQISTQCGSSYAGNLKFWANIAKKKRNYHTPAA